MTLVPGEAVQVPPETFRQLLHEDHRLLLLVARYQEMLFRCSAQSAACNRVHPATARLARWLATACIRNGAADLQVTQDFLASMLGVRRPTVTLAVGQLEEQGVITCRRGSIEVLDRDALLAQCCRCFEPHRGAAGAAFRLAPSIVQENLCYCRPVPPPLHRAMADGFRVREA
ncbi:MAG: winged helix-turn-helix domain-containing protein [Thermoflexaceae bacterium]|nr:winged helix-turn-helix domain-containing protein [Thermoflexaceae bacterium]